MKDEITIEAVIEAISKKYVLLTEECKIDLKNVCTLLKLDKLALLVKEGQQSDKMYFILSGAARTYYLKNGKDITFSVAFEGDFLCSINSFYRNAPSLHNIETIEPTIIVEVSRENIAILSDKHHCFEKLGRIGLTKIMLELQDRVDSLQFDTALQKYENLINIRPDIIQRVPLTHIASYIGITLETLSRIRNPKNRI